MVHAPRCAARVLGRECDKAGVPGIAGVVEGAVGMGQELVDGDLLFPVPGHRLLSQVTVHCHCRHPTHTAEEPDNP